MEKVWSVDFSVVGESAANPDGFTGKFFTTAWGTIADDVFISVLAFFCEEELPRGIIAILVVLLPKIAHHQDFSHFRPISVCNVINKIISRILADRLAQILPKIVFVQQSGFVKSKVITKNFLLAQELLDDIGKKNKGGNAVLKLDMVKAYDRVSLLYLFHVLKTFSFRKGELI